MSKQVSRAAFRLDRFSFPFAKLDLEGLPRGLTLHNIFSLKGFYRASAGEFKLSFRYEAIDQSSSKGVVQVSCQAIFRFASNLDFDEIPEFFYQNSVAILFPYVRAFVSSLTLQANVTPIVLETLNLSSLKEELKNNTTEE